MKYKQLHKEYEELPSVVPLPLLLARALALQAHYEEKSVGDLFSMLNEEQLTRLTAEHLSKLAVLMDHCWNWLQEITSADELPFLTLNLNDDRYLHQRGEEIRAFLQITLGVDQEQLLHYEESSVAQLTEVVRAFKAMSEADSAECTTNQLSTLALDSWEKMLNCRPLTDSDSEVESILTSSDQVYLALREVHADGSWDELETMIKETEELAADHDPIAFERLQKLELEGCNLLEELSPEIVGLIDTALQLNRELKEWSEQEPQDNESAALQQLALLLLYRDDRAEQAWDQLQAMGSAAVEPLCKLLSDVLCQHVVGPGFGLNFVRLIELTRELGTSEFKREIIGLLHTPLPAVLEAVGDLMAATPELFFHDLKQLLTGDRDLSHFNTLLVIEGFPLEQRREVALLLAEESGSGRDQEWATALYRLFSSLERSSEELVRNLIDSSDEEVRIHLQQLQELQQR